MQYKNLIEVIKKVGRAGTGITFIEDGTNETFLSYAELYACALNTLAQLRKYGISQGNEVIFQVEDNRTFVICFWACILGGIIPVPLTIGKTDDHRRKLFNVWAQLSEPYLLISRENLQRVGEFAAKTGLQDIYSRMEEKRVDEKISPDANDPGEIFRAKPEDIAFIQFSSGSTGSPKGVVLTHKNLLTNIGAISASGRYKSGESMISWMPLTHDMGLIGFHLNPLFCGMNQFLMPPGLFIRRPALWLDKVTQHHINILSSPNFGYEYLLKHCDLSSGTLKWDLSSVRLLYNGAEPISERLCRTFLQALAKFKLKSRSMCPVYGLAEASLAVSMSALKDEISTVIVDRKKLNLGDRIAITPASKDTVSFVNLGKPVNDCLLLIADDRDQPVPAQVIGHVLIKGDNVTSGYYKNEAQTNKVMTSQGWLRTGDLGFIKNGNLYITGRMKDIIFVNGGNYYPHDIERIAEEVPGVELNKIAVGGYFNAELQKEEVIAFLLHRNAIEDFIPLARSVKSHINGQIGLLIDRIIPVADMPRTTSGKLQRFLLLDQFKKGSFKELDEKIQSLSGNRKVDGPAFPVPDTNYEEGLLKIWKTVCKDQSIGVTDHFFEVGGNSLKAAEVAMLVLKEFQIDLPPETLYVKPTIRELAAGMETFRRQEYMPIPLTAPAADYPLTSAQRRLYYIWAADQSSIAYNIPLAFEISRELDAGRLEDCLKLLVARHDSLRSSFHMTSEPRLRVEDSILFTLGTDACEQRQLDRLLTHLVRPFDLSAAPLFRCTLLTVDSSKQFLFLDFHHIVYDGISAFLFLEELTQLYRGDELSPLPVGYKDYAAWERTSIDPATMQALNGYWTRQLQDERPVLDMPMDFSRPVTRGMRGGKIRFPIDRETTARLRRLATSNSAGLHALLFTLYYILLSKYTGQEDIIIGIPVAGRRHPDLLRLQGMFVNNLAIRVIVRDDESFAGLLRRVQDILEGALQNQDMPFGDLIPLLQQKRDMGRNPVFDTMLIYQNMGFPQQDNTFSLSDYLLDSGSSKFDISMEIIEQKDMLQCNIEYSAELFERGTILRLAEHFNHILNSVLNDPTAKITAIQPLAERERDVIIQEFNATAVPYPKDKTIQQLFGAQVNLHPDKIAVEWGEERLTYAELDKKSEHLAAMLRQKGAVPNVSVGILLPRSPALIISILAVLKSGGCYLPIEPDLPSERIKYMIVNSQCRLTIAAEQTMAAVPDKSELRAEVIDYDKIDFSAPGPGTVEYISTPHNLAYIMYTSGTTGQPKGVMIEHTSLVNYITWAAAMYVKGEQASFPLHTSIAFDLTITSIFTPLLTGNRIVIYDDRQQELLIRRIITENRVNIIKLTPSHLRLLLDGGFRTPPSGSNVRRFIVGGEKLETSLAEAILQLFGGKVEIYNEYGPTEATVGCMIHKFESGGRNSGNPGNSGVPIGVPAANARIYLLDKHLNPVPAGVKGEIYISGDVIARGYLFNSELTSQKFIADPFVEGRKMYKTGDIARRLSDGNIDYIGRHDRQVKINGYRIELSDIESQTKSYNGITEALVTVKPNLAGKDSLYAYYISGRQTPGDVSPSGIRNYLAGRLPHYMIPIQLIEIDHVPLTKNGKVDYDALPAIPFNTILPEDPVTITGIEELSLQVWEEVLGKTGLTVTENFFELGGDSISAVRIASGLRERGIVISPKDILTYHTLRQISTRAILAKKDSVYEQEILTGVRGPLPIESWFLSRGFGNQHYYNQSVLLDLPGSLDHSLLEKTLTLLIGHHDGLRMNYDPKNNVLFYNNRHLEKPFVMEQWEVGEDLPHLSPDFEAVCRKIKAGFDISNGLLFKAAIIKKKDSAEILLLTAHHLVMDGVSWRILLEDLYKVYHALENEQPVAFPSKTASAADWEKGLRSYADRMEAEKGGAYWDQIISQGFEIPVDHRTVDWMAKNADSVARTLVREKTDFLLKDAHLPYRTDVPILLHTALLATLKKWTGLQTFIIQQESHGRYLEDIDVSRTIGWFTAMYPAKLVWRDGDIGQQIRNVKEQIRNIPDHGLGYGVSQYILHQPWERKALQEIRFNYLGQFGKELDNDLFSYHPEPGGEEMDFSNTLTAKLDINCMVIKGELNVKITYNSFAHDRTTIDWLMDSFFSEIDLVLEYLRARSGMQFTPSDFSSAHLDQEELDALFN